ncbi:hypothetical protein Ccrd_014635 [Cynara cardunculus var. scolymus]|uniref:H15 domain-containing protein n=1 Tax=Cynara cardunculus var. scolymus TaxID=59895 RepID=A0A124SGN8_CYNCS|nr:hypothetical protein Ccrd_014635 [Cynara cardunculus var. scolymus]
MNPLVAFQTGALAAFPFHPWVVVEQIRHPFDHHPYPVEQMSMFWQIGLKNIQEKSCCLPYQVPLKRWNKRHSKLVSNIDPHLHEKSDRSVSGRHGDGERDQNDGRSDASPPCENFQPTGETKPLDNLSRVRDLEREKGESKTLAEKHSDSEDASDGEMEMNSGWPRVGRTRRLITQLGSGGVASTQNESLTVVSGCRGSPLRRLILPKIHISCTTTLEGNYMIKEAIVTLKERTGSSNYSIMKFIEEKQKNLPANSKDEITYIRNQEAKS